MTIAVSFAWWWPPAVITAVAFLRAIFWPHTDHSSGWMPDLTPFFRMTAALIISLFAWAIAGVLK